MRVLQYAVAFDADVSVDYDHHADFGRIHSYSWIGARASNSLWQDRITQAVDSELSARRGTASGVVSSKPEKNEKKLAEAVDKMFKKFPPPEKD